MFEIWFACMLFMPQNADGSVTALKDRFHVKGEKFISSPSHRFVIVRMHADPELSLGLG